MDGVCRVVASGSMVRWGGQLLCSRNTSICGAFGPSFYLRNTGLVINVVPVTVVSFDRHTAKPAMTPPFEALREARCFTLGESLDFVQVMVKALNQLFNAILSFGTRKKLHTALNLVCREGAEHSFYF
jgi:hypothetical protein